MLSGSNGSIFLASWRLGGSTSSRLACSSRFILTPLVFEMTGTGMNHRDVVLIAQGNGFGIAVGAAGVDDGGDSCGDQLAGPVGNRKERVARRDRTLQFVRVSVLP